MAKRLKPEADHSPPCTAHVKNGWKGSYISPYAFGTCTVKTVTLSHSKWRYKCRLHASLFIVIKMLVVRDSVVVVVAGLWPRRSGVRKWNKFFSSSNRPDRHWGQPVS